MILVSVTFQFIEWKISSCFVALFPVRKHTHTRQLKAKKKDKTPSNHTFVSLLLIIYTQSINIKSEMNFSFKFQFVMAFRNLNDFYFFRLSFEFYFLFNNSSLYCIPCKKKKMKNELVAKYGNNLAEQSIKQKYSFVVVHFDRRGERE